jgi:hypothetical protein
MMTGTTRRQIQTRTTGDREESTHIFIYSCHASLPKEAAFPRLWLKENSYNDDYFWISRPK